MRHLASSRLVRAATVVVLLAAFAAQVIWCAQNSSVTFDEVSHLPAGYAYLRWHDYRLNPKHPPLVNKLAALPLLWGNTWPATFADFGEFQTNRAAGGSDILLQYAWIRGLAESDSQWAFGDQMLFGLRPEAWQRVRAAYPQVTSPWEIPTDYRLAPADYHNDADALIFRGRMVVMLLGVLLGALVFCWARELSGFAGGVLALALFCFDPNFIAHSGLVTTDLGAALFIFGTMYFAWRCSWRLNAVNRGLLMLCFALAFGTKFTAVLLVPMFWLAVAGRVVSTQPWPAGRRDISSRGAKVGMALGLFIAASLAAYLAVWGLYSFRYSAAADPAQAAKMEARAGMVKAAGASATDYREPGYTPIELAVRETAATRELLKTGSGEGISKAQIRAAADTVQVGPSGRLLLFAQKHRLLPEAFLYAFAYAEQRSFVRLSYLRGESSTTGFRDYFLWTFLLKTPVPAILLVLGGLVLALRRWNWNLQSAFLIVPVGVYLAAAVGSHLNIGHRHLLPIYPFLYVLAGGLAVEWRRLAGIRRAVVAAVVLLLIVISSQVVFAPQPGSRCQRVGPHQLAYFNELAGGPYYGGAALVDSNLDWGQGLKDLKRWLDERGVRAPIYLCYFGRGNPSYYQIPHHTFPGGFEFEPQEEFAMPPPGSLVAISASKLSGIYLSPREREGWGRILEQSRFVANVGYSISVYEFVGEPAAR